MQDENLKRYLLFTIFWEQFEFKYCWFLNLQHYSHQRFVSSKYRKHWIIYLSFHLFGQIWAELKISEILPKYRISSYKALPRIIPSFLIMPAPGTLLCMWNLVISNNTRSWRHYEKIIFAGFIWGNTVYDYYFHFLKLKIKSRMDSSFT